MFWDEYFWTYNAAVRQCIVCVFFDHLILLVLLLRFVATTLGYNTDLYLYLSVL